MSPGVPTLPVQHGDVELQQLHHHIVVVRRELPLGVIGAQLLHASGESARLAPLPPGTHAVLLEVEGQDPLLQLEAILTRQGIPHAAVREPDEPWCGQLMAIGLAPLRRHQLTGEAKRFLRRLSLFPQGERR